MSKLEQLKKDILELEDTYNDSDTPDNVKELLKPSIDKAKKQLAELEKETKPKEKKSVAEKYKPSAKKETKPAKKSGKKVSVSKALEIAKKYRSEQGLSTKDSDIERDAKRGSKPAGKRVSEDGNVYYENRENRSDRHTSKYPKLEHGGRTTSAINKDRAYQSEESWEQNYDRKTNPKHPKYDKFEEGGKTDTTIASEILNQLGGMGKLKMMTGAYNFVAYPSGVSFKLKNPSANYVKITLNGLDLYDLEVGRIRGDKYTIVHKDENLYNDMLKPAIEKATGMYLSLFKKGGNMENAKDGYIVFYTKDGAMREKSFTNEQKEEAYEFAKQVNSEAIPYKPLKHEDGGMLGDATNDFRFDITNPSFKMGGNMPQDYDGSVLSIVVNEAKTKNFDDFFSWYVPRLVVHNRETDKKLKETLNLSDKADTLKVYNAAKAYKRFEDGGMIPHGFKSGDIIYEIYKGFGIIEAPHNHDRLKEPNGSDVIVINPNIGKRFVIEKSAPDFKAAVQKARDLIDENPNKYFGYVNEDGVRDKSVNEPVYEHGGKPMSQSEFNALWDKETKRVKKMNNSEVAEEWNKNVGNLSTRWKVSDVDFNPSYFRDSLISLLVENQLSEEEYNKYFSSGGKIKKEDIVGKEMTFASTGVPVKIVDYDENFGGRVKFIRTDGLGDGKESAWKPIKGFKYASGGEVGTWYKEGSNKWGLEKSDTYIQQEGDKYIVNRRTYHEKKGGWHWITRDFDTLQEAKEYGYYNEIYASGGALSSKDKFIKDMRHLKDQIHMVQLEDGTLISGKDLRYAKGGSVDAGNQKANSFLNYIYPQLRDALKDLGLMLTPDYEISDGGTKYYAPQVMAVVVEGDVTDVSIAYPEINGGIALKVSDMTAVVSFPEADINTGVLELNKYAEGGSLAERTTVEVGDEEIAVIIGKKERKGYPVYISTVGYAPITHNLYPTREKAIATAKSLAKRNGYALKYAEGGTTFSDKVKAVSKKLTGSKVASKYKAKYGAKYSPAEAKEAATKIVGAMVAKSGEMAKKGGRKAKVAISKGASSIINKYKTKK